MRSRDECGLLSLVPRRAHKSGLSLSISHFAAIWVKPIESGRIQSKVVTTSGGIESRYAKSKYIASEAHAGAVAPAL